MKAVTHVIHCAAALPRSTSREIRSTNVEGTAVLSEAAQRLRVERFVFISSTAVYGIPDHHPIIESDPLRGVGPYGESKILAEENCLHYRDQRLCVPILRPKTFVGPERLGVFELLYSWAYDGRNFPVLGSGANRYQLLDVEDLCVAIHRCCTADARVASDTFNVAAKEFGSMRDNIQAVLDRAGHGARVVSLPAAPFTLALKCLERLHLSPLYPWIYATASKDSFVAIERISRQLQCTPTRSNREALTRNYDWYVAHRSEFTGQTGVTHRVPWNHGVLRLARHFF